ncbi:hypothetical protein PHLCEN_2v13165 [Hermanssonia centrifuga]|uniref:Uncharacterized protein n=1 Tax=Hermanssonia centrifuga TaxID=98765 RepID=A0A2R6NF01_9APHY|nr:hypothetical protein PHLCEN_2v13165 [Hermanssonia centrifuga]
MEAYGGDCIFGVIYCGGPVLTRSLHSEYIHPHLLSVMHDWFSTDGDTASHAAETYLESIVEDMDKTLSYDEQLQWMGSFAIQSPTVRIHTLTRTQTSAVWEREIRKKPVMIVQGTHDRHARAEGLLEVAKKWIGGEFETRLVDGVGHAPHVERAHEVSGYVAAFMHKINLAR